MCLAIPGKILSREEREGHLPTGKVDFGGVVKEVCLAYVPDAKVGDYVIVHVGFALNTLNEAEAKETFEYLRRLGEFPEP